MVGKDSELGGGEEREEVFGGGDDGGDGDAFVAEGEERGTDVA